MTRKRATGVTILAVLLVAALALGGCSALQELGGAKSGGTAVMPPTPDQYQTGSAGAPQVTGEEAARDLAVAPEAAAGAGADASKLASDERLIILDKTLRMQVEDVPGSVEGIRSLTAKYKGIVTNMQVSSDDDSPVYSASGDGAVLAGWVTVRVPNAQFDAFVADASKLGKVLRQSQNSQDVTQEHVDLKARLGNLRAEEKRLREFFASAKKVSEMLEIERELSRVRGEIESLDAQVKYLERQAAMATVTFELVEPKPVVRPQGEDWGFVDALTQSVRAFVGTVNGLIVLLGPLAAIGLLVILPVWLVVRALMRRRRARSAAAEEESTPGSGS